jgi:hypothetical protein
MPAVLGTYSLSAVAATIGAIWSCNDVLRASYKSASRTPARSCETLSADASTCWLFQTQATFAVTGNAVVLVGACTQAGPLSLSDLRPFAAVSEAGCHAFLQVISGVMALYAAHLHAQQRVKPPATVPTASGTRTAYSVSS